MDKSAQIIGKQKISFSNGNEALLVVPSANTLTSEIVHALSIPRPQAVILIVGGAAEMREDVFGHLVPLFTLSIAALAASLGALIIDGGTQSGVMALTGQGVAAQPNQPTLLGIAPAHNVVYPGKTMDTINTISALSTLSTIDTINTNELSQLDPNHTHFVLVDSNRWGGETETMYELARHFSQQNPSVAVVANGGGIAKRELLYNVRQQRPVIIIEGSGRLADEVARLWKEKPTAFPDAELAEIITQGNIHLFSLAGSHRDFTQLLQSQLLSR